MRALVPVVSAVSLLAAVSIAKAELRGHERDEAKRMVFEKIYLRTDVPTNDHVDPFIEISPAGYSWERRVADDQAKKKSTSVYWPFRPNDMVKWGKPRYERDTITVWFEGQKDELKVIFVHINTLDDFKRAFDRVFSRMPLQDEHPDWPDQVRQAIVDRQVIEGMTTQQASCVIGTPVKVETAKEAGADVLLWYPRQETGDLRRGRMAKTGLPSKLKFVNDRLTAIEK